MTDLMELTSPEVRKEFNDIFEFAKKEGAVAELTRPHFAQRFAADPYGTRREIDQAIAGHLHETLGNAAVHVDVHEMPGYPVVSPDTSTAYPNSWVPEVSNA